jgi:hypothetical protein
MTATFLLVLLIGFGVMALVFLLAGKGLNRKSKWLGVTALALAAPFFYWLGVFSEQFVSGQCYSRSIHLVSDAVASTDSPSLLAEDIRALPLHGYETVCSDVEAAAGKLPGAGASE